MKGKRHTEEQIIAILKEHEAGMKTADLCRYIDGSAPRTAAITAQEGNIERQTPIAAG